MNTEEKLNEDTNLPKLTFVIVKEGVKTPSVLNLCYAFEPMQDLEWYTGEDE